MRSMFAAVAALLAAACATTGSADKLTVGPIETTTRFNEEMMEFAAADAAAMPPKCGYVFTGSSSILYWRTLSNDFPDRQVLNRGFGGSTVAQVNFYFDKVLTPYKPIGIVLYAGENDINAGKAPDEVYRDFETFMALKRRKLGATPVWYISAKPSKLRVPQFTQQTQLNTKIKTLAERLDDLAYIDVVGAMLKPDGSPKDIFVNDDLHMTSDGYEIWTPIVEKALSDGQTAKAPGC